MKNTERKGGRDPVKALEGLIQALSHSAQHETIVRPYHVNFARDVLSALRAHNSDSTEPDAYVDWKSQCVYMAESIKDPSGLQPVWFALPPAKEVEDE